MKSIIDIEALKGKVFESDAVAMILGLCEDSIRRKIRQGVIAAKKVPGKKSYTITGESIIAYLLGETASPPPPAVHKPKVNNMGALPYKLPKTANARLKEWLEKSNMTQKEMAEISGIKDYKLSRILNGRYAITRPSIQKLRAAFGDNLITYLMGLNEN